MSKFARVRRDINPKLAYICGSGGMADTRVLEALTQVCEFKSRLPHQKLHMGDQLSWESIRPASGRPRVRVSYSPPASLLEFRGIIDLLDDVALNETLVCKAEEITRQDKASQVRPGRGKLLEKEILLLTLMSCGDLAYGS